jgi:glycosyl hydrolase family 39 (putative alpha-L-iduronidase)
VLVAAAVGFGLVARLGAKDERAFDVSVPINPADLSSRQLDRALEMAEDAGVTSISAGAVWWYLTEGRPPRSYDWRALDRLVTRASERGLRISLQLSGTPDRIHPKLADEVPDPMQRIWYPPRREREVRAWANFVHDVVARYGTKVTRYELWNEPNVAEFWRPAPSPEEFARLMRAGYTAAKSVDPDVTVVSGGLSRNDLGFLKRYYDEAGKLAHAQRDRYFFDVLGLHPYSDDRAPGVTSAAHEFQGAYGTVDTNFTGMKRMFEATVRAEGRGKRIWIGEYGFSTTRSPLGKVSDRTRARYLEEAFDIARSTPGVDGLSWYTFLPASTDHPGWAIVSSRFRPSMTYEALQRAAADDG